METEPHALHMAPTPCPPGAVELVLTDEQVATVAHWLDKPALAVVIGSVHFGRFDGPAAGKIAARLGAIPREHMDAVRAAALGAGDGRKKSWRARTKSPMPGAPNPPPR